MGYLSDLYGSDVPKEFVEGFLAAMDTYAVWKDGERFIGSPERLLKPEMEKIIKEFGREPAFFESQFNFMC